MTSQPGTRGQRFLSGATEDRPAIAAGLMVTALFLLGLQDAMVKLASDELSLWQFQLIRASCNLLFLVVLSRFLWGSSRPRPKRLWAVAVRCLFLVGAMFFYFSGMPFLTLAEIAAGLYVFPLIVAVLSALLLGEHVGPRRIVAILIGFAGTLLILKPGTDAFQLVGLMPIAAALCYAGNIITTRRLCRDESPVTLAYGVSVLYVAMGVLGVTLTSTLDLGNLVETWPYLFRGWTWLALWVLGLIVFCSCLNIVANIFLSKAYQTAEASWLAPFDYSYLIFATFWGLVIWGDLPDALSLLGMAMIAGAGSFVAWRERQENRQRQAQLEFPRR